MTGGELRKRRWAKCRWPHQVLSPSQEAEITAHVARWRSFIRERSERLAAGDSLLGAELEQAALIRLWRLGSARLDAMSEQHTAALLCLAICDMYRREREALGGARRLRIHLEAA